MTTTPTSPPSAPPSAPTTPGREVLATDTVAWLGDDGKDGALARDRRGWSVISSIPDVSETGQSDTVWRAFFARSAGQLLGLCDDGGLLLLFQTDTRGGGLWVDKSAMITAGVVAAGGVLLMRKIICRRPPGTTSTRRAAYTHLLAYGRGPLPASLPDTVADVIDDGGPVTWTRGVGLYATRAACDIVARYSPGTRTIADPFCGEGMILAVANERGFNAFGIERQRKRAEQARRLRVADIRLDSRDDKRDRHRAEAGDEG
jgi:hypothetical protein